MFEERNLIYFDPFYFKNGNTAKPKYFVVLKRLGNKSVLASLPTRKDNIPSTNNAESGCIELPDINLNCFVLPNNTEVTDCGKLFTFKTYLYGHQIDEYDIDLMQDIYPNEGSDYEILGKIKPDLFAALIDCFKNSKSVKRKYRKLL